ncbi:MAG: helix-turn-helix transcriptional regulator [Bacteroidota bacterium]
MDTSSREFQEFQLLLSQKAKSIDRPHALNRELFAIRVKMEDYVRSTDGNTEILTVGSFLRLYLKALSIKQNKFAIYIGLKPSNFSKILSGSRKLNMEQSMILGHLFNIDPKIWIQIQLKNEYRQLKEKKSAFIQRFKLDDLIT